MTQPPMLEVCFVAGRTFDAGHPLSPATDCFLDFHLINLNPQLSRQEWHPHQWSRELPDGSSLLKLRRVDQTERLLDIPPQGKRMPNRA